MDPRELSITMAQLKGAPLAILCVLFGVGRPLGRNELVQITTYSAGSVTAGLERLEFLGLVAHSSRYAGWLPTAVARQLPFAMPPAELASDDEAIEADAAESNNEVQNMYLGSSSSSSLSSLSVSVSLPNSETTPPEGEVQKMNLADDDAEEAVALLIEAGCPERSTKRNGARDAVEAALARGWSGGEVLEAVEGWLAYAETPAGRWINHRGFLAGKRIAAGIAPPELSREEESRRYLEQVWAERGLS
jgi:hypothetical protein